MLHGVSAATDIFELKVPVLGLSAAAPRRGGLIGL
jgi:hypothetical protein